MEGDEQTSGGVNYQPEAYEQGEYLNSAPITRPHREKFNSVLILSIGFFAIIIGGVSMWVNLANPFEEVFKQSQKQQEALAAQQQAQMLAQQSKDTDGDGLNDYDELNKYNTSPYLKDSDGDNVDDKSETSRGTDPNCPEGQNCFAGTASADGSVPSTQTSIANPTIEITPAYIRQMMKQNGATDAEIGALSDDDLMAEFNAYVAANPAVASSLAAQGIKVNVGAAGANQTASLPAPNTGNLDLKSMNINNIDDLKKLTGAQIRQLMINSGASASVLSSVTDDQLKASFLAQLQSKQGN